MREKQARFADTLEIGDVNVTPLIEAQLSLTQRGEHVTGSGSLKPLGVLIEGPDGAKALDLDGNPLPLKEG